MAEFFPTGAVDKFVNSKEVFLQSEFFKQIQKQYHKYAPKKAQETFLKNYQDFVTNKKDIEILEDIYAVIKKENPYSSEEIILKNFNYIFKNIKTLKSNNPSEFQTLVDGGFFKFVKQGKISTYNLRTDMTNARISRALLKDLEIMANKGEFIKDLSHISKKELQTAVKNGEIFMQNNKLFTKHQGVIKPINLTKEKYLELFPPVLRHISNQGNLENCWAVGQLDNLISSESGMSGIPLLFRQHGDDIYVKLPSSSKEILFPKGIPLKSPTGKCMTTVPGLAMLEQSLAVHYGTKYSKGAITNITDFSKDVDKLMNNLSADKTLTNIIRRIINRPNKYSFIDKFSGEYTSTICADGTCNEFVASSFFSSFRKQKKLNKAAMDQIIKEQGNDKNLKLGIVFVNKAPEEYRELYNIIPHHQLTLQYVDGNICWISNPWYNWLEKSVDINIFKRYLRHMTVPYKW